MATYSISSSEGTSINFPNQETYSAYNLDCKRMWYKHYSLVLKKSGIWASNQDKYVSSPEQLNSLDAHAPYNLYLSLLARAKTKRPNHIEQLKQSLTARNRTIRTLEGAIHTYLQQLDKAEIRVTELEIAVEMLRGMIENGNECDCSDWESIGTDSNNGDKLKRCNICDKIGVR